MCHFYPRTQRVISALGGYFPFTQNQLINGRNSLDLLRILLNVRAKKYSTTKAFSRHVSCMDKLSVYNCGNSGDNVNIHTLAKWFGKVMPELWSSLGGKLAYCSTAKTIGMMTRK
jgi:hypothetical protein